MARGPGVGLGGPHQRVAVAAAAGVGIDDEQSHVAARRRLRRWRRRRRRVAAHDRRLLGGEQRAVELLDRRGAGDPAPAQIGDGRQRVAAENGQIAHEPNDTQRMPGVPRACSTAPVLHRRRGLPDDWVDIVEERVALWSGSMTDERALLEGDERLAAPAQALGGGERIRAHRRDHGDDRGAGRATRARPERRRVSGGQRDHRVPDGDAVARGLRRPGTRHASSRVSLPVLGEAHDGRGPVLLAWDQAEDAARNPGPRPQRRVPRVRPQDRHARRHRRRHPAAANAAPTSIGGSRCAPRRTTRCGPGSTVRPSSRTARRTRPSSSRSRPRRSSTCPVALEQHEPRLYDVMRDFYNQDPARRARTGSPDQ